eukprot:Sspe_Gene.103737::Locus_79580_Transcript_1_1_Confidence_1.000_Length_2225::g.103737::m.103737
MDDDFRYLSVGPNGTHVFAVRIYIGSGALVASLDVESKKLEYTSTVYLAEEYVNGLYYFNGKVLVASVIGVHVMDFTFTPPLRKTHITPVVANSVLADGDGVYVLGSHGIMLMGKDILDIPAPTAAPTPPPQSTTQPAPPNSSPIPATAKPQPTPTVKPRATFPPQPSPPTLGRRTPAPTEKRGNDDDLTNNKTATIVVAVIAGVLALAVVATAVLILLRQPAHTVDGAGNSEELELVERSHYIKH